MNDVEEKVGARLDKLAPEVAGTGLDDDNTTEEIANDTLESADSIADVQETRVESKPSAEQEVSFGGIAVFDDAVADDVGAFSPRETNLSLSEAEQIPNADSPSATVTGPREGCEYEVNATLEAVSDERSDDEVEAAAALESAADAFGEGLSAAQELFLGSLPDEFRDDARSYLESLASEVIEDALFVVAEILELMSAFLAGVRAEHRDDVRIFLVGVPLHHRYDLMLGYDPATVRAVFARSNMQAVRYWGSPSGAWSRERGHWLTPYPPPAAEMVVTQPHGGSADSITTFIIPAGSTVLVGRARSRDGQPGGAIQIYVPDADDLRQHSGGRQATGGHGQGEPRAAMIERVRASLRRLLALVDRELQERQRGVAGEGTITELQIIQQELLALVPQLARGQLPPRRLRTLRCAALAGDSWPHDSALGGAIARFSVLYGCAD